MAHAFPTYAGHVPLTGLLRLAASQCIRGTVVGLLVLPALLTADPPCPPPACLLQLAPAEYGTQEGVPNKLYFVPHAKVGGRLVACRYRCQGFQLPCRSGQASSAAALQPSLPLVPVARPPHPPTKLAQPTHPRQALIFFKSVKAGFLLGVEQGQGFMIARCTLRLLR